MLNLAKRNSKVEDIYLVCNTMEEDIKHTLLECTVGRQIWVLSNLPSNIVCSGREVAWTGFEAAVNNLTHADWFRVVCWNIWNNLNKCLMERLGRQPLEVANNSMHNLEVALKVSQPEHIIETREHDLHWSPIFRDKITMNFDGASFRH
ncbi:hypothetical protein Salat_2612400 [Sesamum alatum]|uniref:Reverse transcriptase zinc-binding domain-containing protein n=1 Tax=Sesamum alatum TaxID=300844 RepID=A0AAE2CAI7_9LAMI|nr:hypothetical protein Salat_2612400 [Sesamum alatum]